MYPLVMNSQYMFREFSFYYFFLENVLITNGKCRALVIEASFKNQFTGKKHAKPTDLSRNFWSALQHSIWLLSCYAKNGWSFNCNLWFCKFLRIILGIWHDFQTTMASKMVIYQKYKQIFIKMVDLKKKRKVVGGGELKNNRLPCKAV